MKKSFIFLSFILVSFLSNGQEKKKIEADKKVSYVQYAMKHPMHDWDAKSTANKCIIVYNDKNTAIEAVAVIVPVKSFDSGNSNRDSHALESLEALKFPNVSFSASNIQEANNQLTIKGNLTFHGVTKPIEVKAKKTASSNNLKIEGKFDINMKDFGVEPPGLMGVRADEKISLSFNMVFNL
jgi:polyisoprenoid-binding protein YceI